MGEEPPAANAAASSFKKTMTMDEELVRNCRKVSSVRFRDRCHETDVMKWVKILRQELGKLGSDGKSGSYQYLRS
jgi:hypothetical protein